MEIRVLDIVEGTSVDGPGLRTSIYLAGCRHHCPGCHNPQSWDFDAGKPMTDDEIIQIVAFNDFDVTLSGGDPMYQPHTVAHLCRRIKQETGKRIWCYTGFLWEQLTANPETRETLRWIDVIVDGQFVEAQADTSLLFRGSANQRIIDVADSMREGVAIELTDFAYLD
ncbi:MAG: anaerobic ribonucleoside-triphosphate reductase activating protein [Bacteroidales bacterium]|nr:anaerobic ribonucleoside-triphosphate reductase activating protein [Bacteroidales bacterium]